MIVFATGCTGFVGRSLVRRLLQRTDLEYIYLLTRGKRQPLDLWDPADRIKYWKGDITDCKLPGSPYKITHLIHGACDANDLLQPDRHYYYYTIVEGARRVFEWAKNNGVPNTLFLSSGVAAFRDTVYGRGKRQSEFLAEHYKLPNFKIARIFSVIGEEMPLNGQYAVGKFIHQAIFDKEIRFWGGTSVRSYIHVDDCAEWCNTILQRGFANVPYDVGGSEPITVKELAYRVGHVLNVPVTEIQMDTAPVNTIYVPRSLDTQENLHVTESIGLDTAIKRCAEYVKYSGLRSAYVEPSSRVGQVREVHSGADYESVPDFLKGAKC